MRKALSLLLIVMTYWMSTWMVTDIHDVVFSDDQPHPIFSAHSADSAIAFQSGEETAPSGCKVCSYDHGGHFGQTLPATLAVVAFDPVGTGCRSFCPFGWISHTIPPKLRPPIA